MIESLTALQWLAAAIAAFSIGLSKTGFGGVSMIGLVLMAQLVPARESTGIILPMLIFADLFAIWTFRKTVVWHHVRALIPIAFLGVITGWFFMKAIPSAWFQPILGGVILGMVLMQFRKRIPLTDPPRPAYTVVMGWLGGVTTMLANAAGPVMTLYLLRAKLPKWEFVGTAAWFFFLINLIKLPFSWELGLIHGASLIFNLFLLPAILAGAMLGRVLIRHVSQTWFERITLWFTLIAALHLIWRGIVGT